MTTRTFDGRPLTPGVNVDPIDLEAGLRRAAQLGYSANGNDTQVVTYALQRWARGEEGGAENTWMSHFGKHTLSGFRVVLASAVAAGTAALPGAAAEAPPGTKWVTLEVLVEYTGDVPTRADVATVIAEQLVNPSSYADVDWAITRIGEARS